MSDSCSQRYPPSAAGRRINGLIFYLLLLLVVLAPIPLGSNRSWSWSLSALLISSLSLLWVVNVIWYKRRISLSISPFIMLLFLIPALWALLQGMSGFPQVWTHPLWGMAFEALGSTGEPVISIAPGNSHTASMRLLSYGLTFFLTFQFCRNRRRAEITLKWLAIAGVVYALYGLISYWGNISIIFWSDQSTDIRSVSSTFINRNSYATFAGLGLLCLMAYSLMPPEQPAGAPYGAFSGREQKIETYIFGAWKPLLGLMIITTALISTQSRGGFISAGVGVLCLLLIVAMKKKVNTKFLFAGIGGVLAIVVLAYAISSGPLSQRLVDTDIKALERIEVFRITIDAIGDNPGVGFGYGSFEEGFKMYRNEAVHYIYDKAHNTYLENLFELGVPAAMLLFLAIAGAALTTLKGLFSRNRDWLYPATGLSASLLVAVHSSMDFSLQIPAISLCYSAIMGLAVAQSFSSSRS